MRYRYRIEPTPAQQTMLARVFGCARVVFNDALRVRDEAYRAGVKLSDSEIQRRVITAAKTTERARLAVRGAQCGVGAVGQRLAPGLAQLLRLGHREAAGWPQWAGRGSNRARITGSRFGSPATDSASDPMAGCSWRRSARSGALVARAAQRAVERSRSSAKPTGTYYASFVVDVAAAPLPAVDREAGVDVGIARLATIAATDGERVDVANPKHLGRKLRKLRRLEREKSRRQKGSTNRDKTRRKVAVAHNEVARARRDYHHKQALALVRENQVIHVEDLNIAGHGQQPSPGSRDHRCWVGAVRADHRREGRPLRAHRAHGVAVAGVEQDLLGVRAPARRAAAAGTAVDVPDMPGSPRPRPQRRQGHSRCRAGRETKRLWSSCKTRNLWRHMGDEAGSTPTAA